MPNRRTRLVFSAVSLAIVLALVWIELEQDKISPGPLAGAHARVPELVAPGSCQRCHGSLGESLTDACADCHAPIARQLEHGAGFHGTLADGSECGLCHEDHGGADAELVGALAFALAGVEDVADYDHAGLEFGLEGPHADLACAACHPNANADALAPGEVRFLGLQQRCASCHVDPHAGRMGTSCERCHEQTSPFDRPSAFEHPSGFPLTGGHAGVTCAACHAPTGPTAVVALLAGEPHTTRGCVDCHPSPHTAGFAAAFASSEGVAPDDSCSRCHAPEHDSFAAASERADRAWHRAGGFALDGAHGAAACGACHVGSAYEERFPGRAPEACGACHADPHGGQFTSSAAAERCGDCHTTTRFRPAAFDAARHAATRFALTGAHAGTACRDCHRGLDAELGCVRFRGLSGSCESCHADPHAGQFASAGAVACEECHTTRAFSPGTFDLARHAETAFPLTGGHAAVGCFRCHADDPDLGCVRFAGTETACAACHADPHAGSFAATGGGGRCGRCHDSASFAVGAAFEHGAETDFPLDGAHAALACELCHPRTREPDELGRTFGRIPAEPGGGTPRCETCHADPHADGFGGRVPDAVEGRAGCARCHGVGSFRDLRVPFDHGAWTAFPLGAAHRAVGCESCHGRTAPRDGGRTLGLARGSSCADCHADPHVGQFRQDGRTDCARCHTDAASFTTLDFDHDRDTRFPLDERHAALSCGACHRSTPLPDGRRAVRYKPLGTTCADCHLDRGERRSRGRAEGDR